MRVRLPLIIILLLACGGFGLPTGPSQAIAAQLVDRIVAIVNDEVITQRELDRALATMNSMLQSPSHLLTASRRRQALEQLIHDRLLQHEMAKANVTVAEQDIESALQRFLGENGITREELIMGLEQQEMTIDHFQGQIAKQLRQMKYVQQTLGQEVQLNDQELWNYFLRSLSPRIRPRTGTQITFAEIRLPHAPQATPRQQRKALRRARKIATSARRRDFGAMAKKHSVGSTAKAGGRREAVDPSTLTPTVDQALQRMKVGTVSDPIRTDTGLVIVKLLDRPTAARKQFETKKTQIEQQLYQSKMSGALEQFLGKLRAKAYIEIRD